MRATGWSLLHRSDVPVAHGVPTQRRTTPAAPLVRRRYLAGATSPARTTGDDEPAGKHRAGPAGERAGRRGRARAHTETASRRGRLPLVGVPAVFGLGGWVRFELLPRLPPRWRSVAGLPPGEMHEWGVGPVPGLRGWVGVSVSGWVVVVLAVVGWVGGGVGGWVRSGR